MSVPAGKVDYSAYYGSDGTYSVSPPEYAGSETSESGNGSYSYSNANYSTTTSSYAGSSQGDYDTAGSASGVDLNDYMQDRFTSAFDPVELDKGIAAQAKT
jgi:biogenesis of lysosome-related organelles complex 1 subunit KXD1